MEPAGQAGKPEASHEESARLVLPAARSRSRLDRADEDRLPRLWKEAAFEAESQGVEGVTAYLKGQGDPKLLGAWCIAIATEGQPTPAPEPVIPTDEELGLTDLSGVTPTDVRWLWPNRIPAGKLTLLAGEGGIGKTFLTLDLIATVSRGRPFADTPEIIPQPADSIFLTAEDDLSDTIVPRLMAMGADLSRVRALGTAKLADGRPSPFTLADVSRLDAVLTKYPATRLIIIDPVTAFLGRGIDDGKNAELRGILGPLSDFAARHGVAIICITHFNKSASPSAASRVMGSVAYSNAARATFCVLMDPEQDGRRLMLPVKANLSPNKTGMAYTLVDGIVEWERDPIDLNVNEVLGSAGQSGGEAKKRNAIEIIRAVLAGGPLTSEEVIARCQARGIGKHLVWKYKPDAGVDVKRDGFGPGAKWLWRLADPPASF